MRALRNRGSRRCGFCNLNLFCKWIGLQVFVNGLEIGNVGDL